MTSGRRVITVGRVSPWVGSIDDDFGPLSAPARPGPPWSSLQAKCVAVELRPGA
jgi:hypothetical protein